MLKRMLKNFGVSPRASATSAGRDQHKPHRFRPRFDCLEDRVVPATINVTTFADVVDPGDGKVSLREAITRANVTAMPDVIVLKAGVYRIGIGGAGENGNASGDFDITNPVTIVGQGSSVTAIDGGRLDRIFEIMGTFGVGLAKLTLRNGSGPVKGGAIHAETASIRLDSCAVIGNTALDGGGINAESGNVTVVGCTFNRNVANGGGGAIKVGTGQLTLRGCTVTNNLAHTGGGLFAVNATVHRSTIASNSAPQGLGGGLYAVNATLIRSTVNGNFALKGGGFSGGNITLLASSVGGNSASGSTGGIDAINATLIKSAVSGNSTPGLYGGGISASTVTLINSNVNGNSAREAGGGIFAGTAILTNSSVSGNSASLGGGLYASTVNLTSSTVNGNLAAQGGGIYSTIAATLTNCTVSGNIAGEVGGGIHAITATLTNCTVTLNSSLEEGGGIFHEMGGTLSVKNTIIAQNFVGYLNSGADVFGDFASQGHNLIGDASGSTGFGATGDQVGTADNPLDARLAPLAKNGGPTLTHALLAGSTAIDQGDNATAPLRDQRGVRRPRNGDGKGTSIVDIGAFER